MKKTKKAFALITVFCILFTLPVFRGNAAESVQETFCVNEDHYTILETNPGAFEISQLKNFKLRDSDIPLCMADTEIRQSDSIVRLKIMENDLSSLVYLNSDGTLSSYLFGEAVKFGSGEDIRDKTNILNYDLNNKFYYNPDNDISVKLPMFLSESKKISVDYNDYSISFAPLCSESDKELIAQKCFKSEKEDYIKYDEAFGDDTAILYSPMFSGLKEDIIISSPTENNTFAFRVYTNGLKAISQNNQVILVDPENRIVADISELIITDSTGYFGNGHIELEEIRDNEEYLYTIIVDSDFLNNDNTIYPVTVDPTVTYSSSSSIKDVQVNKDNAIVNPSAQIAQIGYNSTYEASRFLVKFPNLSTLYGNLSSASQIVEAKYYFRCTTLNGSSAQYGFFPCTAYWDPNAYNINTSVYYSYLSAPSEYVTINGTGQYTANLLSLFRHFYNSSSYNGFLMKIVNESTYNFAEIRTIDSTNYKPYLVLRYSEPLPSSSNSHITNKSVYRIKNYSRNTYLTKNATVSGTSVSMSFGLESLYTAYGSTREKSQFVSVNYVGSGKYTLSFLMPPTSSSETDTTTGYSSNYYIKCVFIENASYLTYTTTLTNASKWYIVYDSVSGANKIINAAYPWMYLYASSASTLYICDTNGDDALWCFERCGYDVPLYMQCNHDACGWACTCMILKYYGVSVTELNVRGSYPAIADYNKMAEKLNYYLNLSAYDGNHSLHNLTYNAYKALITQYLNNRPICLLCLYGSNSQFGWGTSEGHYIVVKGVFTDGSNEKCLVNDCYYDNCRERIIYLSNLQQYNEGLYGYGVFPID